MQKLGKHELSTESGATHTEMALRMQADKRYSESMDSIIGGSAILQKDIAAYKSGDMMTMLGHVAGNYDYSKDYWKLKMYADGSHEIVFDGEKELSIDYLDEAGEIISTSKPGSQDMSDVGMAGSIGKILGLDRAEKILGSKYTNANLYDTQTLKDILKKKGYTDNDIDLIQKKGSLQGIEFSDSEKYSLVGEALMKKQGAVWSDSKGWGNTAGIAITITDGLLNGNIMAEISNGKYLYSTVTATVFRDPESWKSLTGTQGKDGKITWVSDRTKEGLDYIEYRKTGINYNYTESLLLGGYQTVDNMITNSKGDDFNQPYYSSSKKQWLQGNTVVSRRYNYGYISSSADIALDVLVKNNAITLDGQIINNKGTSESSLLRWLEHANRHSGAATDYRYYYSDGCDVTTYINQSLLLSKLRQWNLTNGYQISAELLNISYRNYRRNKEE